MPLPVVTVFGDMKAIKTLNHLTGFLTLYPSGKRENERKAFRFENNKKFNKGDLDFGLQTFGDGSGEEISRRIQI